jgi:hypothetical protein
MYKNTFHLDQINQYCAGLKCVSYSVTQVKTQLHETLYRRYLKGKKYFRTLSLEMFIKLTCFSFSSILLFQQRRMRERKKEKRFISESFFFLKSYLETLAWFAIKHKNGVQTFSELHENILKIVKVMLYF